MVGVVMAAKWQTGGDVKVYQLHICKLAVCISISLGGWRSAGGVMADR